MADISITAANVKAQTGATIITVAQLGVTGTAGQLVYRNVSTGKLSLGDANAVATAKILGILLSNGSDTQPCYVCTKGPVNMGATLVLGKSYFCSDTAGGIQPDDDNASGEFQSFIGIATTTAILEVSILNSGVAIP